ncbi:MAG: cation:proton antiporter [Solirubrobacteraceae bacterium]|nr:cation:proton antiporter [Patulibacter sp.]
MDFGALALVVAAGLLGPVLATTRRFRAPIVVGELLAGIAIGHTGLRWVDGSSHPLADLGEIGFALLMLIAGTHLPLRAPGLRQAAARGAGAAVLAFLVAVPVALVVRAFTPFHETGLLVLLLATSSSAIVMPILADGGPASGAGLVAIAWVAIADVATVVGIPLVMASDHVAKVIAGSVLVLALSAVLYVLIRAADRRNTIDRQEALALQHGWGLRLRLSLLALFVLAWVATSFGTSVLIAGFSLGMVLALVGEPESLARELIGVGEGFFVPIFFVTLGARLDVRALFTDPENLVFLVVLLAGIVLVHVVVALLTRRGWPTGLVASAQLGVPSAIASLGLANGTIRPGQGAAIVTSAIASVGLASFGAARLGRSDTSVDRLDPSVGPPMEHGPA